MKNQVAFRSALIALFAALISVSGFIRIALPFTPVPIVLQNGISVLTGVVLGSYLSAAPAALWLCAGLIGLPVFSGGTSGLAVLLGPSGGFPIGYVLAGLVSGLIAGIPSIKDKKPGKITIIRVVLAYVCGMVILYVPGLLWFSHWALGAGKVPADKTTFAYTMGACCIPFIPGDIIKTLIGIPVALVIRPVCAQYLFSSKKASQSENNDSDSENK